MKKYILPLIIAILFILLVLQKCQTNKFKDKSQLQSVELSVLKDSVTYYYSKDSTLTAKLLSIQIEKDNVKKALELAGFEIKDLRQRDVKWRDVVFALKSELEASGHGSTTLKDTIKITRTDTIRTSNFNWNNRYLWLSGNIEKKQMDFSYKYKTALDLISEKKGQSYVVSVYLSDPNAVVISANSITITPIKRWYQKWYIHTAAGLVGGYFIFK